MEPVGGRFTTNNGSVPIRGELTREKHHHIVSPHFKCISAMTTYIKHPWQKQYFSSDVVNTFSLILTHCAHPAIS